MVNPLPLLVWLVACGADPVEQDVLAYQTAMEPLLARNLVLAQGFLDVASKVKKAEMDGGQIAEKLARDVVPVADALVAEAGSIEPATPALADAHAQLLRAWGDRATAYHGMADAWMASDLAAFDTSRKKNLQSKLDEEKYFQTVNALTGPYGVVLDQYPQ